MSKWITIEDAGHSPSGKTKVWNVRNIRTNEVVGQVKWHGPFRKYCFYPEPGYLFDKECLLQIASKLGSADAMQRAQKTASELATLGGPRKQRPL